MSDQFDNVPDGADYHRRFYRGEDITSAFDDGSFSARVADGTFRDIFLGDFIRKEFTDPNVDYVESSTQIVEFVVADLDSAMNYGCHMVTAHHAVIVPRWGLFSTYMNPTDTNAGGYAASYMNRTVMPAFAEGLAASFGLSHLLKFNADGRSCLCRLMTLSMVFGHTVTWWPGKSWSDFNKDDCMGGEQLAAFRLDPLNLLMSQNYWVSDTWSAGKAFAIILYNHDLGCVCAGAGGASLDAPPLRLVDCIPNSSPFLPALLIFKQQCFSAAGGICL